MNQITKKKLPIFVWKNLTFLANNTITILTLFFLLTIWRGGDRFLNNLMGFFQPTKPEINNPTLIIKEMREVSELTTTVFVTQNIVPTSSERKLGDLTIATTKLLYIAHGEVKAGVNLENLTEKNINVTNNNIEIILPPPEILDSKIDVNRSQVYDYNRGFLGLGPDVAPQLQELAQRETLNNIEETACKQGILEQANEKAKLTVTKLLHSGGYENIKVITSSPEKCLKK